MRMRGSKKRDTQKPGSFNIPAPPQPRLLSKTEVRQTRHELLIVPPTVSSKHTGTNQAVAEGAPATQVLTRTRTHSLKPSENLVPKKPFIEFTSMVNSIGPDALSLVAMRPAEAGRPEALGSPKGLVSQSKGDRSVGGFSVGAGLWDFEIGRLRACQALGKKDQTSVESSPSAADLCRFHEGLSLAAGQHLVCGL